MVKILERALAEAASLPEAAQEQIGRQLLEHISKLQALRRDLEQGIASLDAGRGSPLTIEDVLSRARKRHGLS